MKLALVQSPRGQPDPYTVMHQHFHAVGAAVGEQISTVRLRRTEYLHYTGQCGLGAGAHVHRLSGKPDAIDADHGASPRTKRAQPSGSDTGHFTVTDCSPSDSSIITDAAVGRLGVALNGTNADNTAGKRPTVLDETPICFSRRKLKPLKHATLQELRVVQQPVKVARNGL